MDLVEIKHRFEKLSEKWVRLFELLQTKRLSKESIDIIIELEKPVAAKLVQIKKREKLRSIGFALFGSASISPNPCNSK